MKKTNLFKKLLILTILQNNIYCASRLSTRYLNTTKYLRRSLVPSQRFYSTIPRITHRILSDQNKLMLVQKPLYSSNILMQQQRQLSIFSRFCKLQLEDAETIMTRITYDQSYTYMQYPARLIEKLAGKKVTVEEVANAVVDCFNKDLPNEELVLKIRFSYDLIKIILSEDQFEEFGKLIYLDLDNAWKKAI